MTKKLELFTFRIQEVPGYNSQRTKSQRDIYVPINISLRLRKIR